MFIFLYIFQHFQFSLELQIQMIFYILSHSSSTEILKLLGLRIVTLLKFIKYSQRASVYVEGIVL